MTGVNNDEGESWHHRQELIRAVDRSYLYTIMCGCSWFELKQVDIVVTNILMLAQKSRKAALLNSSRNLCRIQFNL